MSPDNLAAFLLLLARGWRSLSLASILCVVSACGQSGPLVLPEPDPAVAAGDAAADSENPDDNDEGDANE